MLLRESERMIDRTIADKFIGKIVKIETNSEQFNYYKGRVLEVTGCGILLESMSGHMAGLTLEEITIIREAE